MERGESCSAGQVPLHGVLFLWEREGTKPWEEAGGELPPGRIQLRMNISSCGVAAVPCWDAVGGDEVVPGQAAASGC